MVVIGYHDNSTQISKFWKALSWGFQEPDTEEDRR